MSRGGILVWLFVHIIPFLLALWIIVLLEPVFGEINGWVFFLCFLPLLIGLGFIQDGIVDGVRRWFHLNRAAKTLYDATQKSADLLMGDGKVHIDGKAYNVDRVAQESEERKEKRSKYLAKQKSDLDDGEYVVRDGKMYRLTPVDDDEEDS